MILKKVSIGIDSYHAEIDTLFFPPKCHIYQNLKHVLMGRSSVVYVPFIKDKRIFVIIGVGVANAEGEVEL